MTWRALQSPVLTRGNRHHTSDALTPETRHLDPECWVSGLALATQGTVIASPAPPKLLNLTLFHSWILEERSKTELRTATWGGKEHEEGNQLSKVMAGPSSRHLLSPAGKLHYKYTNLWGSGYESAPHVYAVHGLHNHMPWPCWSQCACVCMSTCICLCAVLNVQVPWPKRPTYAAHTESSERI